MIAGRLRECLTILRWKTSDLAEELGYPESEVAAWLDGRARAPLAVAAWLEALVTAYKALPRPGQNAYAPQPVVKESGVPEIRLPAPVAAQSMARGRPEFPLHRRRAVFEHIHASFDLGCELSGSCPFGPDRGDWSYQASDSPEGPNEHP